MGADAPLSDVGGSGGGQGDKGTGGYAAASYFMSSVFRSNLHMAMDSNRTSVSCGARLASWRFVEKWDG